MKNKILVLIIAAAFLLLLFIVTAYAATHNVSSKSLNSIACPDGILITDVFVSEKADLRVDIRKDKVFFEFMATRLESEGYVVMQYTREPTTIALFCGDDEYSLTLVPREINGVSISLAPKVPAIVLQLDGLRREEQLAKIVQMIFLDELKGARTVSGDMVAKLEGKEVYLRRIHSIAGYRAKEIYVHSELITTITEAELLSLPFINFPVAMTLPDYFVGWQRVVVIEEVR